MKKLAGSKLILFALCVFASSSVVADDCKKVSGTFIEAKDGKPYAQIKINQSACDKIHMEWKMVGNPSIGDSYDFIADGIRRKIYDNQLGIGYGTYSIHGSTHVIVWYMENPFSSVPEISTSTMTFKKDLDYDYQVVIVASPKAEKVHDIRIGTAKRVGPF